MKIQSIFIFCIIFNIVENGKLTKEENEERLEKCGKKPISHTSFQLSRGYKNNDATIYTTATLISKRHALTSSKLILEDSVWLYKKQIQQQCNSTKITAFEVNLKLYPTMHFNWAGKCEHNTSCPIRAFLMCNNYTGGLGSAHSIPLVLELDTEFSFDWPCLPNEKTLFKKGDSLELFSYGKVDGQLNMATLKVAELYRLFVGAELYKDGWTMGGPLIRNEPDQVTLMGISGKVASGMFHDMRSYEKEMCNSVGICSKKAVPTTVIPEKPSTVVTEESTTEPTVPTQLPPKDPEKSSTTEERTLPSEPPESLTSSQSPKSSETPIPYITRPSPTPPPGEFIWKHSDIDGEFGDFLDRNEGWNDESEENNDIFLSDDFLINSGNSIWMRMELFVLGFLVLVL